MLTLTFSFNSHEKEVQISEQTVCNPMDLSYRFRPEEPSRREAADPTMLLFKDTYYLFASKSGGYWKSDDLVDWEFIRAKAFPSEEYAPTAIEINDTVIFLASSGEKSTIYKSGNPDTGNWEVVRDSFDYVVWDPAFFMDDDQRLYLYWGCSDKTPIYGVEVDYKNNFATIGERIDLLWVHPKTNGWEVRGDSHEIEDMPPFFEGAWMNKYKGKYYLQYSAPGTEYKTYSDGVYIAENPLGPYSIAAHNPFAYHPEGFACGAGHGSTFPDKHGNYWHVGTISISEKHMFERRLAMHPVFFDADDMMYANTRFGDYPMVIPQKKISSAVEVFPNWMLLSYKKKVKVSSYVQAYEAKNMVDENIRTYWAAVTGSNNEWASIDLGEVCTVNAVQINFAEHNTNIYDRQPNLHHRYLLEVSNDAENWTVLIDKSENNKDNTHDYTAFDSAVQTRFLRVKNIVVPDGHFALSGFRVFGKANGDTPAKVEKLNVVRNQNDRRKAEVSWDKVEGAMGYIVRFGIAPDKLYQHYKVYEKTLVNINSLSKVQDYYFAIEAFNENGTSELSEVKTYK